MAMNGIAFVFPGQGSQYIGMGKDMVDKYHDIEHTFNRAKEISGVDYLDICLNGPAEKLNNTVHTQPCIYILSMGIFRVIDNYGFKPQIMAGHSLGEYTALTAARALKFSDGLRIVAKRAELMGKEADKYPGKMFAVLGADMRDVDAMVSELSEHGTISVANYNCPGQIVISVEAYIEEMAIKALKDIGVKKVVELPVSGAFHSAMMTNAENQFTKFLDNYIFLSADIPIVPNTLAKPAMEAIELRAALQTQMSTSVKWQQSIEQMIGLGIRTFIEVGPGQVLSKIIKRIDKQVEVLPTETPELLDKVIEHLKNC
ncbi:MAG: ACP S-malonyltransferase [Firmicutes bacterium]|nr:ACP S-malonyltransferase [Bacillota bacterium]